MSFIKHLATIAEKNVISKDLYAKFKVFSGLRDPLTNEGVLVGLTEISSVNGSSGSGQERKPMHGELKYRGIDINEIVAKLSKKKYGFEIVSFLLLFGRLPTADEEKDYLAMIKDYMEVPQEFVQNMILRQPSSNVMNKLGRSVLTLYSYDSNAEDNSIENNIQQSIMLVARFPTLIAYAYIALAHYFKNESLYVHHMDKSLSLAEHFLHMIRPDGSFTEDEAEILDVCLMLHAEHGGGNNSTFTARVVTSSETDIYSAIAAAVGSLKGPLHGGANQSVMAMMDDFMKNIPRNKWNDKTAVGEHLAKIFKKEAYDKSGLLYGFGHAVYTLSDPRAIILEKYAKKLAKLKKMEDEFSLYMIIKEIASDVFKSVTGKTKIIAPNVDFFSGFVYKALGLPPEVYTAIFAMSRVAGWCAHRIEELVNGQRIIRPAYEYVGDQRHKEEFSKEE